MLDPRVKRSLARCALAVLAVLVVVMLLMALSSSAHAAPVGKPFLRGVNTPAELASKVEASLTKDSKGVSIIDLERCNRDGSCATPANYLEMFKVSDPEANLTEVGQLPGFLRTLKIADAPKQDYWLACLKPSGKSYQPVLHCLSRSFKQGEKAWIDPKSRRLVLASDCTNPIEKSVPPKLSCVEVHFFTKPGDTVVRFGLLGPAAVADDCIGVKRAGEEDFERWWTDECAARGCDFSADAKVVGQPVQLIGSYVPAPGEHVLRLPALVAERESLYRTVLCLERGPHSDPPKEPPKPTNDMALEKYREAYTVYMAWRVKYEAWRNSWIADHSDGIGVRSFDYRASGSSDTKSATVWYDKAEVPKNAPQLYWSWHEWKID